MHNAKETQEVKGKLAGGRELSGNERPLEAWDEQQSTSNERFHVIFDGKVYTNSEWVDAGQCPGDTVNRSINPWRFERNATDEEMKTLGNPTSCTHIHHPPRS
ncbi:hypothetical protein [Vitiosangium sp. GDMCC 1.1324]|uniref:hypothetical protein n=1 Tax=Vitiosangium sp. (strain GDMCC 1.1324) TaxID=2138576 RepID=UPI000D37CAAC|nr:hypothetical protein [Vitiosangium sp. GDMCC 1.1324]